MSTIGYARVSTTDQCLDLQLDALRKAGCERVERDQGISGSVRVRPGLEAALEALQAGDKFVVWRLDRLGRSLPHLLDTVEELKHRGVQFASLTENIDTSTASGELVFHIFASIAQFERQLIRERTNAGLAAAKRRGQQLGRPRSMSRSKIELARKLRDEGASFREIGRQLGINYMTVSRALGKGTP